MDNTFFALLLGHLIGDYIFQTEWMAQNKTRNDLKGWVACIVHASVYATCVVGTIINLEPSWTPKVWLLLGLVFLSHFPIDKFSLGKYWITYINRKPVPKSGDPISIGAMFYPSVYIAVDNTMHLVLMVAAIMLIR